MSEFAKNKINGIRYRPDYVEIGDKSAPLAYIWASNESTPTYTPRVDSKIISGKIYNYVYNDIAECVPSDGSLEAGDIAMVDLNSDRFRLTKYDGVNSEAVIGVISKEPGFIVGLNSAYEYPVFVALKGMVWVKADKLPSINRSIIGVEIGVYKSKVVCRKNSIFFLPKLLKYKRLGTIIDIDADKSSVKLFI